MALFSWFYPRDRVTIMHIRQIVRRLHHLEGIIVAVAPAIAEAIEQYSAAVTEAVSAAVTAETAEVIAAINAAAEGGQVDVQAVVDALSSSRDTLVANVQDNIGQVFVPGVVEPDPVDPSAEPPVEPEPEA